MTSDQERMINELMEQESGLSAWEIDFIESIEGRTGSLSDAQASKLQEIYDRLA